MLLFVLFFCQDRSPVCIRCQPEPELSGEEHTPTGQQQHEGPTHLCKRHADGETKTWFIECVDGAPSLCFVSKPAVNTNINVAFCHNPPNDSLTLYHQSAAGLLMMLTTFQGEEREPFSFLLCLSQSQMFFSRHEIQPNVLSSHSLYLHLFLVISILANNMKLKSTVCDKTNEIIFTCFHP